MFQISVWANRITKILIPENDNQQEISYFDVKDLYDAAFAEKDKARGNLRQFTRLLDRAAKLEQAYREQEALSEMNEFRARAHKAAALRTGGRHG